MKHIKYASWLIFVIPHNDLSRMTCIVWNAVAKNRILQINFPVMDGEVNSYVKIELV